MESRTHLHLRALRGPSRTKMRGKGGGSKEKLKFHKPLVLHHIRPMRLRHVILCSPQRYQARPSCFPPTFARRVYKTSVIKPKNREISEGDQVVVSFPIMCLTRRRSALVTQYNTVIVWCTFCTWSNAPAQHNPSGISLPAPQELSS